MGLRTPRGVRFPALSLTTIASRARSYKGFWLLAVWQQPAGNTLDVAGFRDGRMHRVIRALAAAFQHLDIAIQVAGAG